jgi:hypothetical protein
MSLAVRAKPNSFLGEAVFNFVSDSELNRVTGRGRLGQSRRELLSYVHYLDLTGAGLSKTWFLSIRPLRGFGGHLASVRLYRHTEFY